VEQTLSSDLSMAMVARQHGEKATIVINALSAPPDSMIIRTIMESMYLMYGSIALFLRALLMTGYAGVVSSKLPSDRHD
jgi:hypothetical protein